MNNQTHSPMQVRRHHLALVALHWLLAILIPVALVMGSAVLSKIPNSSPEKIDALKGHMIAGGVILLLMLVRVVVRRVTVHPPAATTGFRLADKVAVIAHLLLYVAVLAMAASGISMAVVADLPAVVFGAQGALPADFANLPARTVHGVVAKVLMALIALHIAAVVYHQWVRRDGLLARMGWGAR